MQAKGAVATPLRSSRTAAHWLSRDTSVVVSTSGCKKDGVEAHVNRVGPGYCKVWPTKQSLAVGKKAHDPTLKAKLLGKSARIATRNFRSAWQHNVPVL